MGGVPSVGCTGGKSRTRSSGAGMRGETGTVSTGRGTGVGRGLATLPGGVAVALDVGVGVGVGVVVALGVGRAVLITRGATGTTPLSSSTGPCARGLAVGVGPGGREKSCADCAIAGAERLNSRAIRGRREIGMFRARS